MASHLASLVIFGPTTTYGKVTLIRPLTDSSYLLVSFDTPLLARVRHIFERPGSQLGETNLPAVAATWAARHPADVTFKAVERLEYNEVVQKLNPLAIAGVEYEAVEVIWTAILERHRDMLTGMLDYAGSVQVDDVISQPSRRN